MDYKKKGAIGTRKPNATVAAQLMTGIGSTFCEMVDNGAQRQARVKAAVPRPHAGTLLGAVDPRCVTPAEDTQEPCK